MLRPAKYHQVTGSAISRHLKKNKLNTINQSFLTRKFSTESYEYLAQIITPSISISHLQHFNMSFWVSYTGHVQFKMCKKGMVVMKTLSTHTNRYYAVTKGRFALVKAYTLSHKS